MLNKHNVLAIATSFLLLVPQIQADELVDKGRKVFKANQGSVVTIQIVIKSKMSFGGLGGQDNESKQDVTGTVIEPNGLTVLSLSSTDPGGMFQTIMAGMSDQAEGKFKMDTELNDIKMLLDDGSEVPCAIVLRDKDLDLAFIRPKAELTTPLPALDLTKSAKADILDQVVALNRLGKAANRAYAASFERIAATVQKPRLFYVPDSSMSKTSLGSPAFNLDGQVIGVFVMRATKPSGGMMGMLSGGAPDFMTSVIVPAEDVLKAAKQAPAVKPPEKSDEKEAKKQ